MRRVFPILPCVIAIGCTRVLGIDGTYERSVGNPSGEGGSPTVLDAGNGGAEPMPPSSSGAGGQPIGAGGEVSMPPEFGGAPMTPLDAGHSCLPGAKWCGTYCDEISPATGCGQALCNPCGSVDVNAHPTCGSDGKCGASCNTGYAENMGRCVLQAATGGAGGTSTGGGGAGAGGGSGNGECDPVQCPTCNRGFEGCCIPSIPNGPASRCGCFYFPPLCTARVG